MPDGQELVDKEGKEERLRQCSGGAVRAARDWMRSDYAESVGYAVAWTMGGYGRASGSVVVVVVVTLPRWLAGCFEALEPGR